MDDMKRFKACKEVCHRAEQMLEDCVERLQSRTTAVLEAESSMPIIRIALDQAVLRIHLATK